jgi:hypothetical protein
MLPVVSFRNLTDSILFGFVCFLLFCFVLIEGGEKRKKREGKRENREEKTGKREGIGKKEKERKLGGMQCKRGDDIIR